MAGLMVQPMTPWSPKVERPFCVVLRWTTVLVPIGANCQQYKFRLLSKIDASYYLGINRIPVMAVNKLPLLGVFSLRGCFSLKGLKEFC